MSLYEEYNKEYNFKDGKCPPINTIADAEKRIHELQERVMVLEADAEMEFFNRLNVLEENVAALAQNNNR